VYAFERENEMRKSFRIIPMLAVLVALLAHAGSATAFAREKYPPSLSKENRSVPIKGGEPKVAGIIFTNNHNYGNVEILVTIYDNYFGDVNKYWWVYTVTNHTYDPNPGSSNGFSGFELALTQFVPDIADQAAPNAAWIDNCCSGQPVEWDIPNGNGPGVMPGQTGVFSFTTLPRLITQSTGWFHTWQGGQTDLVFYPAGDGPESPDLQDTTPQVELCCHTDATGRQVCEPVAIGTCVNLGGRVVTTCDECVTVPVQQTPWGKVKSHYR
jgi:hypothetical protein